VAPRIGGGLGVLPNLWRESNAERGIWFQENVTGALDFTNVINCRMGVARIARRRGVLQPQE
jgi:hypothetical protein